MHRNKPVAQLLGAAIPVRTPGLQVIFMLLLGAAIFSATAIAAPAKGDKQAAEPAASDFVGSDTCATCHQDVAKGFAGNPHNKIAEMHGKAGISCEGCHGPGKAHVEGGGDVSKILDPAKASPKQVDEKCLSCHGGAHPNFMRSPHAKGGVSCISCHSIHAAKTPEHLLTAAQPELCFQCHNDVKPQFSMPFHHPVNEGLVKCGDCHDVHGTFGNNNLKSTADQNAVCTKCHAETRGPFVYEHAPVKAEGCLACHSPHGSQNARMLNAPSVNTLCNQCHSPVASHTVTGMGQGSAELAPCTSCHTYIHGSNLNQAFLR